MNIRLVVAALCCAPLAISACKKKELPPAPPSKAVAPSPVAAPAVAPAPAVPVAPAAPAAQRAPSTDPAQAAKPGAPGRLGGAEFVLEGAPAGTALKVVAGAEETTWDVVDAGGRPVGRVLEKPWNRAASPAVGASSHQIGGLPAARTEGTPAWAGGAKAADYLFETKTFIYRLSVVAPVGEWLVRAFKVGGGGAPTPEAAGCPTHEEMNALLKAAPATPKTPYTLTSVKCAQGFATAMTVPGAGGKTARAQALFRSLDGRWTLVNFGTSAVCASAQLSGLVRKQLDCQ